ncbi:PAQR-type receptor NDAI_0F01740 [Naumovozyma dairenensis CBS 421]|uniref:Uncharacterized protein n=1 Tax=Naumovozyma dairenensis (strain ATCC 10597 / BCRC 20456 / CBS 421 / NBRC 0211 / NRRL Y-12639) TaxID=1071378 RepID=G0WCI2_NAUDC|nr:hypothetical protein NDAI_0F01740 [Naumovozyma dairenensis CBS 421]CCD25493.1 hypothetical protein NDAI_0F01740 [Naumovozyma dairenensis CBS 421]
MPKTIQKRGNTSTTTVVEGIINNTDNGDSIEQVKRKVVYKLYRWDEIPEWQKDNEHIISGYVRETNSFKGCLHSLFYVHNESGNVYSHLLPGVFFFFTMVLNKYGITIYSTTSIVDYLMIDLFFFGAFCCLILSSLFHCFKSHSLKVATLGNKLDYLGIVILIVTSMISIMYFGFFDNPLFFYFFSSLTFLFGGACATVSLKDHFRSREWRPYRAGLFVAFGLSAILPILAGTFYYGIEETFIRIQLKWIILEGFFYIFGAFLYGVRFPEKYVPGSFDIWGHSHQIFHILVVVAAFCHLRGLLSSYEIVHSRL